MLTNSGHLFIGYLPLSAPDKVTAAALDNTGLIQLSGSWPNQALLDVTSGSAGFGAAGVLSGTVNWALIARSSSAAGRSPAWPLTRN